MAIDEADSSDAGKLDTGGSERVGAYSWLDFYAEFGDGSDAEALREATSNGSITAETFDRAGIDPSTYLGFDPDRTAAVLETASENATRIAEYAEAVRDGTPPVVKGWYSWEDYKQEYFYDDEGAPPTDLTGEREEFDPSSELGFDPDLASAVVGHAGTLGKELAEILDRRTVDINEDLDEDEFFSTDGTTTIANRYDLEKTVPLEKKGHFREEQRYWVNKPFSFVVIFHSTKENEKKYYLVQPHRNEIENDLTEFLTGKLRSSIKYAEEGVSADRKDNRRQVIEDETYELLERYDIYSRPDGESPFDAVTDRFDISEEGLGGRVLHALGWDGTSCQTAGLDGIAARPESAVMSEDPETLSEYQVEKLLYFLKRDFIGYERIDGIKHDINVEDISCDGYNSPVFVYHSDYEQIISNVYHGEEELDDFVVKLAQRSGKGISKRSPQVDATLPDGSRAQLTLGREVSDHGTNYTIRQFKDVPFTPIDLINWNTFSLDEMAFLWLCIENHKSLIFAGGTASGKTTSLNAVSLFIPSNSKIVSIEDTREVELPQRNWIASVTRPSFSEDGKGDIDEFDLLEAALRQRPDYIVMGEIRGEEGRTLFQVMSTGHTTYTTFHADSVGEVLKRFTTEPINVSKTMFTALDLVSIQTSTRVNGNKVRRNKTLTEINRYDAENDEINVQDVYQWQAESDEFLQMTDSNTLEEIKFDRGWSQQTIDEEIFTRQAVLAYLLKNGLNTYTQVAATFQAFINDPETILTLMANDGLEESLEDLREMGSVLIDIDPEKEEMVPRPEASEEMLDHTGEILEEAEDRLFEQYRGEDAEGIAAALMMEKQGDVAAEPGRGEELRELTDETDAGATTNAEPSADTAETEPSAESGKESPSEFGTADRADSEQESGGGFGDSGPFDGDLGFGDGADEGDFSDGATADLGQDPADLPAGSEPSGIDPDSMLDESDIEFTGDGQDETNVLGASTATGDEDAVLFGGEEAGDSFGAADSAGSSDTEAFGQSVDTDEPADLSGDSQPTPQETPSESTTDQSADGSQPDETDVGNAADGEPASESPEQDGPADGNESAAENEEVTEEVTSEESTAADGPADTGEMDSTEAAVDPEEAIDVEGLTDEIADPEKKSEEETGEEGRVEEETSDEEAAEEEASDDTEWDFGAEGVE